MKTHRRDAKGFTLVELLVSMAVGLLLVMGVVSFFSAQQAQVRSMTMRGESLQDTSFVLQFMVNDLRSALYSASGTDARALITENQNFMGTAATTQLNFWVWDAEDGGVDGRAQRRYDMSGTTLRYDRDASTVSMSQVLEHVTFFKVFKDDVDVASRAAFADIPDPLPALKIGQVGEGGAKHSSFNIEAGTLDVYQPMEMVSAYTILIEWNMSADVKDGASLDVLGNAVAAGNKRAWRYMQLHPMVLVP